MQTFLPYSDFAKSAKVLDNKRLGKQRLEAWLIYEIITNPRHLSGWRNHPAIRMWQGHEGFLILYGLEIIREWLMRGFKDTIGDRFINEPLKEGLSAPPWLGREDFHLSHQSNLVRKFPEYYRQFFPDVRDDLPYVWPV
jgi:hypothetical protein